MESTVWYGTSLARLLEDVPAEIVFDAFGIASATLHYQTLWDTAPGLVAGLKAHPQFPWLQRKRGVISREENGFARVVLTYEGISPETDDRRYSMKGASDSSPIESHRNFASKIGGTPENPKNGAIFDKKTGKFKGFGVGLEEGADNAKAGVKSYLSPSLTYEEVRSLGVPGNAASSMVQLGKLDTPPTSSVFPTGLQGRNWLLSGGGAEQVGLGARITKSWRLSGRRGWDTDIYE